MFLLYIQASSGPWPLASFPDSRCAGGSWSPVASVGHPQVHRTRSWWGMTPATWQTANSGLRHVRCIHEASGSLEKEYFPDSCVPRLTPTDSPIRSSPAVKLPPQKGDRPSPPMNPTCTPPPGPRLFTSFLSTMGIRVAARVRLRGSSEDRKRVFLPEDKLTPPLQSWAPWKRPVPPAHGGVLYPGAGAGPSRAGSF